MLDHPGKCSLILALCGLMLTEGKCTSDVPGAFMIDQATIRFNPEPEDPLAAIISSPGGTAAIYGDKGDDGIVTHVDSVVISTPDGAAHSIQFDELDRPVFAADSLGNSAVFTYTDTHVNIDFTASSGGEGTATIALAEIADWPPTLPKPKTADKPRALAARGDGWKVIEVLTRVRTTSNGRPVGIVEDAHVWGSLPDYTRPTGEIANFQKFGESKDWYLFRLLHYTQPGITFDSAACEAVKNVGGRVVQHTGALMTLIAATCVLSGVAGPEGPAICLWLASEAGILTSVGLAVTGSALAEDYVGPDCEDYTIPVDPPSTTIVVDVHLPGRYTPRILQQRREVNLRDLGAPWFVEFTFDVEIGASNCDPNAPFDILEWENGDGRTEEDGGQPELCVSGNPDPRTPTFNWSVTAIPEVVEIRVKEHGVPGTLWGVRVNCLHCGDIIQPPVTYSGLPPNTSFIETGSSFLSPGTGYVLEVYSRNGDRELVFRPR